MREQQTGFTAVTTRNVPLERRVLGLLVDVGRVERVTRRPLPEGQMRERMHQCQRLGEHQ